MEPFYLVWSPQGGRPPSHRHRTLELAQAEAERLARVSSPSQFFVMKALCVAQKVDVTTTALCPEGEMDREIPF